MALTISQRFEQRNSNSATAPSHHRRRREDDDEDTTHKMTHKMSADRFKVFYERYKDTFPYNQVRVTRNSIHSKWLLMGCKHPGIMFYTGRLFATLSETMDKATVDCLIVSRKAVPLPDDFCTVMDSMYFWGRCISFQWYRKTLELLNYFLRQGDCEFQRGTNMKTYLYREVIGIRVQQRIQMSFAGGNTALYEAWRKHYKERINSGETEFFGLAVSSFQFLSNEMTSLEFESQYHADSSMTVVSQVSSS